MNEQELNANTPEHVFKEGDTVHLVGSSYTGTIRDIIRGSDGKLLYAVEMPQEARDAGHEAIEMAMRERIEPRHMYIYEVLPRLVPSVILTGRPPLPPEQ